HRSCPLKSRSTSHTASTGASMIVDLTIFTMAHSLSGKRRDEFYPHSVSLREPPLPHGKWGRGRAPSFAAGASSPPLRGGEVAREARRSGGKGKTSRASQRYPPKCRLSASKPPWKTLVPMPLTRSSATSSVHSNSAVHSAKVRSP